MSIGLRSSLPSLEVLSLELEEPDAAPRSSSGLGSRFRFLPDMFAGGQGVGRCREERERECVKSASKSPLREKGEVFSVPHTKNVFFSKKVGQENEDRLCT